MKTKRKWLLLVPLLLLLPVTFAIVRISRQMRQEYLDQGLIGAVRQLDAPGVKRRLAQGANANARSSGEGALTEPTMIGRLLERLLPRPAPLRVPIKMPALQILVTDGQLYRDWDAPACDDIAVALLQHNARIEIDHDHKESLLHLAACWGMHKTVRLLLEKGADLNARDDAGATPLMMADADSTLALLQHNADPNAKDLNGFTALNYVDKSDRVEVARILIGRHANVNATDADGYSVLYRAQTFSLPGQASVIQLLKENGARLNHMDRRAIAAYPENGAR